MRSAPPLRYKSRKRQPLPHPKLLLADNIFSTSPRPMSNIPVRQIRAVNYYSLYEKKVSTSIRKITAPRIAKFSRRENDIFMA